MIFRPDVKAFFDEDFPFSDPVVASADGTALEAYAGSDASSLTIGGELNKLASNMAIGRNFAGIHFRSDYWDALILGEEVAIRLLRNMGETFWEAHSFTFTKFDGTKIEIFSRGSRQVEDVF